ncbi:MAG: DUF2062 domain-containing protein [Parvularculales bacterium]
MLFRRRKKLELKTQLLTLLWPQGGWKRVALYSWHRIRRLRVSPHAISLGVACGVFVSFTPFLGFHFVLAGACAWLLGGNIIASLIGTIAGNPITFPLIWVASYKVGTLLLGQAMLPGFIDPAGPEINWDAISGSVTPVLKAMLAGGTLLGLVVGVISYGLCRWALEVHRARSLRKSTPTGMPDRS